MARLNISLNNELARTIEEEAQKSGRTVSSLVTEATISYINVKKLGVQLDDVAKLLKFLELSHAIGTVPVPSLLLESMIGLAMNNSEDEALQKWFEKGRVLGRILVSSAPDLHELQKFADDFKSLITWGSVDMKILENKVEIVLSGAGYSSNASRCTAEGIKGMLDAYGYVYETQEIYEGFIRLVAVKSEADTVNHNHI
ncbi:MAG: ribbon-helix-helix domain-containing protein [Candidatus Thermoplasmatota archaeon]|nr:ribbon-helix-helix domain-containing protein [Candidatus Thermoplasmatota archaeon]MCL6090506.1 ribbon-helix-helix domain-containing protein [Candidatus Thermoplasmatota archaeon]MDA8144236.1 ribbon-helix-helix domain-containing protein [Thermoplasmatales archaeon]